MELFTQLLYFRKSLSMSILEVVYLFFSNTFRISSYIDWVWTNFTPDKRPSFILLLMDIFVLAPLLKVSFHQHVLKPLSSYIAVVPLFVAVFSMLCSWSADLFCVSKMLLLFLGLCLLLWDQILWDCLPCYFYSESHCLHFVILYKF